MENISVCKTYIIPILNIYEIYEIILGLEFYHVETF